MQLGTRFSDELIACNSLPVNVDGCRRRYLYSACSQQTLIEFVLHHSGGGDLSVPTSTLCNKFCRILFPLLNKTKIVGSFTGWQLQPTLSDVDITWSYALRSSHTRWSGAVEAVGSVRKYAIVLARIFFWAASSIKIVDFFTSHVSEPTTIDKFRRRHTALRRFPTILDLGRRRSTFSDIFRRKSTEMSSPRYRPRIPDWEFSGRGRGATGSPTGSKGLFIEFTIPFRIPHISWNARH